ncbi:MAG: hypothetical protein DCF22_02040 [Leptolyngbya sp.]|nr:MAG: hypothetical protein DCF22_02040 [Leptolyngbya sp.]
MNGSGLLKAFTGCLVAIALIIGGGFLAAQYLIAQFTAPPPKPMFANDMSPKPKPVAIAPKPQPPPPKPTVSPTPLPKPSGEGYQAKITLSEGLNMRSNPAVDAERVGGVDFDEEITVLKETPDQEWQRIRVKTSNVEGWIKSGHTERIN